MKKKRIISLVLALCMMISLMPVISATGDAEIGVKVVYDFADYAVDTPLQAITYENSGERMTFHKEHADEKGASGKTDTVEEYTTVNGKTVRCGTVRLNEAGRYMAFKVHIPKGKTYEVALNYVNLTSSDAGNAMKANMHLLPLTTSDSDSNIEKVTRKNQVVQVDGAVKTTEMNKARAIGTVKGTFTAEDEEYFLVFRRLSGGNGNLLDVLSVEFSEIDPETGAVYETLKPVLTGMGVTVESGALSFDKDPESKLIPLNPKMSDGTAASPEDIPEITYVSGNEDIIKINGQYAVAQKEGEAEVSAYVGDRYLGKSTIRVYAEKPEVKISLPHPYPYLEKGQTVKLVSSADGLNYATSDKSVATVDKEGNITATGLGKVKITASLGSDSSTVEIPVVGTNLLIRKGVNHGDFENGVYLSGSGAADDKKSMWLSKYGTGGYIYDYELADVTSPVNGEPVKAAKFSVKRAATPEEDGKRTLRLQGDSGLYEASTDNHYGFVLASANKLYEFTGFAKAETAVPDSVYASLYYHDGKYSNATALAEYKGEIWKDAEGSQDWTMFTVPAVYMNWNLSTQYSVDPRFNYSTATSKDFDLLLTHFSFHEVVFDEFVFELDGKVSDVSTFGTLETKTQYFTNTGTEIVLANSGNAVPVTYRSTNEKVATVSADGTITARSNGKCTIIAEATIGTVSKTKEIEIEFTKLETVLEKLEVSVPSEMKLGDSTRLEVKMYNNDETQYTGDAFIYYETKNAEVVSVTQDGVISAKGTGKTEIGVYAMVGNRTISALYDVVVADTTPISGAEIYGINSVEKNFKISLSTRAWYESTKEVYIPSCSVTYALASDADAEFITVTSDGTVSGIKEGTGYVVATVSKGNESVKTDPFPVTVTPIEPKTQMYDFRIHDFGTIQEATIENQKYEVNKTKSATEFFSNTKLLRFQSYGIQAQNQTSGNDRGADLALDIFVEYDGWFVPEFMGAISASGAQVSKLYIGNADTGVYSYLGSYRFYDANGDGKAGEVVYLNPVYLTRGVHTFILRAYTKGAHSYSTNQYPAYLRLNCRDDVSVSEFSIQPERTSIAIGEGISFSSTLAMSTGSEYILDLAHGNKKDSKNNITHTSDDTSVVEIDGDRIVGVNPGKAKVISTLTINGLTPITRETEITVTDEALSRIEFEKEEYDIYKKQTEQVKIRAYVKSDSSEEREIATESLDVSFKLEENPFVTFEKEKITGVSVGSAEITATASLNNVEKSTSATVRVKPDGFEVLELEAISDTIKLTSDGAPTKLYAYMNTGEEIDISRAESISYSFGDGSILTVDKDGVIRPVAEGTEAVTATVVIDGISRSASKDITVRDGKTHSTYYSEKKVLAARENIMKYDWAKKEAEKVIETADKYIDNVEYLYDLIPSEGIPRSMYCAFDNDPEYNNCRYCGEDLSRHGGQYPWRSDAMTRPWKVQCPVCKRLFPSNDFGAFYEQGLNERGEFDRTHALEENGILCGRGWRNEQGKYIVYDKYRDNPYGYGDPNGNLYNELYSELYKTNLDPWKQIPITQGWGDFKTGGESGVPSAGYFWGVDDGYGYDPGRKCSNNAKEMHTYVAEYIHRSLWHAIGGKDGTIATHALKEAIINFSKAYVFTGEARYGHGAAILLDRIADFYPDYSRRLWSSSYANSDGGTGNGKILGRIWECALASDFCLAYDAVFDACDDPEVINFLSERAARYKLTNPKTSGELIRSNFEENFMQVAYDAIKSGDIVPNFGGHQRLAAQMALIFDSGERSQEIIDFIMRPAGPNDGINLVTGGDLLPRLMNVIDRDGFPSESSLGYNAPWFDKYVGIAEILAEFGNVNDEDNFIKNPKFIKMGSMAYPMQMVNARTANIGDHGGTGTTGYSIGTVDAVKKTFNLTGHPILGQLLYRSNGNKTEGLHMDIFTENPEDIQKKVQKVIDEHGEIPTAKSTNVTGYGLATLRDGVEFNNVTSTTRDNTLRDWWIYYGGASSHKHEDMLNLGLDAFGLNYSPDLGYPEQTGKNLFRANWVEGTIAHNTVVVNEKKQSSVKVTADPLHFDDSGEVKVMDIDAPSAYPDDVEKYRRTLVSVDVDDSVSYAVDFFRIDGGFEHVYSFHAFAFDAEIEDIKLEKQPLGTYAGANIEYGDDKAYEKDSGYNYLRNVSRAQNPGTGRFSADFKVVDYRNMLPDDKDWHLKLTMLNDFDLADVSLADGIPPEYGSNPEYLRYLLAKRTGKDLDTLFTTVLEPYIGNSAIKSLDRVSVTHIDGSALTEDEKCAAVKVTLNNGRVDYVVYSPDKETAYLVDGLFEFCGFVGVYSLDSNGEPVRTYLLDGTKLDDTTREYAALTGEVVSFTEGNNFDNYITVRAEQKPSPDELVGKMIDIHNDGAQNGAYMITSAAISGDNLIIGTGDVGYIRSMKDNYDVSKGFVHNFEIGDKFEIPLSMNESDTPVINVEGEYTVSAGSSITIPLSIESEREFELTGTTLPRGMSINEKNMTLTWKPDSSQVGDNHVAITADNGVFSDTAHFIVTVYGSTMGSKPSTDNNASDDNPGTSGGGGGGGGGGDAAPDNGDSSDQTDVPQDTDSTQTDESGEKAPDVSGETNDIRFTDLANHAWASDAINSLATDGIIKGTSASTFSPSVNITRADFALLLVRAFKLSSDDTENFVDVSAADYFASELAIARNCGIVSGIGDNRYAPRNHITRQDMMVIVYRALNSLAKIEKRNDTQVVPYDDFASVADYARDAVSVLIGAGLVNGKSGLIAPTDYTTRAEVAVLIKRILDYVK